MIAKLEIYVLVDENGDCGIGVDAANAADNYTDNIQPLDGTFGTRLVVLTVTVPLPTPVEIEATVPDRDETPSVTVK
jgi:hypothetical protein